MTAQELEGEYTVVGSNQTADANTYKGILTLILDDYYRIRAKWLINDWQEQLGYGFFKDNILVINFNYKGDDNSVFKGVAVYKCLSKDLLEGFWSEKHGDPNFIGTERCYRVKENKDLN
ncbi:hypothetical protein E1J38_014160 [Seonamhaeicola sediminis]|uniref:Uncharacterized protein n=1 Tax=Seonamhaeicola sediminis TaxID=2528206 RepID=A0A562Y9Z1_9FLAO|nr:hypothetical protein [Seonamhaeicola sediminis]TWO31082.1 hypothetical protein E1J38_014160 [Seonamhaeicola sediminis]